MALSFDDGPGEATPRVLDVLAAHRAVATFFVVGARVSGREEVLRRMTELGCEIGNHTFTHPDLAELDDDAIESELRQTSELVARVTGSAPRLMRPPFGRGALRAAAVARRLGMTTTLYTVTVHDWDGKGASEIAQLVLEAARPGSVVLLHDAGPDDADRSATVEALAELVPALRTRGFTLATVTELIDTSSRARRSVVPRARGRIRTVVSNTRKRLRS